MAIRRWQWVRRWLPLAIGAAVMAVWAWAARPSPLTAPILTDDISQTRLDTVPPAPRNEQYLEQTFVPRWNGLSEVELIAARSGEPDAAEDGRLTLQLFDDDATLITEQTLETSAISHNQTITLSFDPQTRSLNRTYRLRLSGNETNPVSVWAYDLDVLARGQLTATAAANAQELRFTTRTQLTFADAVWSLVTMLSRDGLIMLLALFFLPLPGCLLLLLVEKTKNEKRKGERPSFSATRFPLTATRFPLTPLLADPFAWWGTAFALGVSLWPMLWFGLTLAGGRFHSWSLWAIFILGWTAVLTLWLSNRNAREKRPRPITLSPRHLVALSLLALILAARLLAVRDLAFPPWVDSGRHSLITAVMTETGQTPSDYASYLPVTRFPYHFGFHTLAASLELMSGWPLPRLLLFLGQLLNSLLPLTVYAAVWLILRRRGAALLAAFLVGLPFLFPGFYATWGRLTQLTAMLVMPVLVAFTWLVVRGGRAWRRAWWLLALLAAGVFFTHFRVFAYYLPLPFVVWLSARGRQGHNLLAAAGSGLLLAGPRLFQLLAITNPGRQITYTQTSYNAFPTNYITPGWERYYWTAASIGLVLALTAVLLRRRWPVLPLVMTGWTAALLAALSLDRWGLPGTTVLNLNSMVITLFLPLALFLAATAVPLWRWLRQRHWLAALMAWFCLGGGLMAVTLFGVRQQISILNPQTILARPADLPALAWADQNLPETAVIAVNSWKWLGETWSATDGGLWLVPLTGRSTTTPPADYTYNPKLVQQVRQFNETASAVPDWSDPTQADWLRQQGVTYIFIGQRGGFFDPAALNRNPAVEMVYGRDGVFIFSLFPSP